jgi:Carboxypeptidase regulatory-like domain
MPIDAALKELGMVPSVTPSRRLTSALPTALLFATAHGQSPSHSPSTALAYPKYGAQQPQETMPMPLVGPVFLQTDQIDSNVTVVNAITWAVQGTLILRDQQGTVLTGHVYDAFGTPADGARIEYMALNFHEKSRSQIAVSRADGGYSLSVGGIGKIRVYVYKESADIPNTRLLLFESQEQTYVDVDVRPDNDVTNADLRLPVPYGVLSGSVRDAKSHLAVAAARVTLRRKEQPKVFSTSVDEAGNFHFALPRREITVTVDAPGYRTWSYLDSSNLKDSVMLTGSDHLSMQVDLTPISATP